MIAHKRRQICSKVYYSKAFFKITAITKKVSLHTKKVVQKSTVASCWSFGYNQTKKSIYTKGRDVCINLK